jgi:hypothetical protein
MTDLELETHPLGSPGDPSPEIPCFGTPITPGEILTMLLMREGTRQEAMDFLALSLADLGISGEEIAHYQKIPGICHDSNEVDDKLREEWQAVADAFPKKPIETWKGYWKKDAAAQRRW